MMSGNSATRNFRYPFTATQWQELELQALIFKYMMSGIPIPTDLVYSFKARLNSSMSARLFPHHPFGWGGYGIGFSRKIDPEPGRCRRTDGKKWRCSKEAYPDSKYCERHMQRGKNRSRKPVEASSSSSTTNTSTTNSNTTIQIPPDYTSLSKTSSSMFSSSFTNETSQTQHQSSSLYPFLNRPQGSDSNPQLFLNSGAYANETDHRDNRYLQGAKESADHELAFFPSETNANARSYMNSYRGYSSSSSSQPQFQSLTDHYPHQQQQDEQHCYVLGTDFKSSRPMKTENKEEADQTQKSLHHFFGDWPPKSTDTWLDLAPNSRLP